MPKHSLCLATAAVLMALPLPAIADCAQRIAAVERHPVLVETEDAKDNAETPAAPAAGSEEKIVKEEVIGKGDAVLENGGVTVHPEGGPATPEESWLTNTDDKDAALTHLDAARKAASAGDEKACLDSIEQAETILKDDAG